MKEVRCPICSRFKKVVNTIKISICPSCQVEMRVVRKFCDYCGNELKNGEFTYCSICNLSKNGSRRFDLNGK